MRKLTLIGLVAAIVAVGVGLLFLRASRGFSALEEPTVVEAFVARNLRLLSMPSGAREAENPVEASPAVLSEALSHFADHCAICHANDGSGDTPIGRGLYPKAPDMRAERTQSLSDGELFYIIHNGIRLTGMPAWGSGKPEEDHNSWGLVHFIRHLPNLSAEELREMEALNPKGPQERAAEEAMADFLAGGAPPEESDHDKHDH